MEFFTVHLTVIFRHNIIATSKRLLIQIGNTETNSPLYFSRAGTCHEVDVDRASVSCCRACPQSVTQLPGSVTVLKGSVVEHVKSVLRDITPTLVVVW